MKLKLDEWLFSLSMELKSPWLKYDMMNLQWPITKSPEWFQTTILQTMASNEITQATIEPATDALSSNDILVVTFDSYQ